LALAALAALPFTAAAAGAAPANPNTGNALSQIDTRALVVDVRKGGGGFKGGGFRGGGMKGFRGGGRIAGFRGGHIGHRHAFRGGRHWHGGGHWQGHRHWHHRHRFYPRWYGVPYYSDYGPTYYYDDTSCEDDSDDGAASDGDAVERCAARYRSFDRRTGTFLSNSGQRKLCPYLR